MSSKALLIVEGERRESEFFAKVKSSFSWSLEIVPFRGNISMLYDMMEETDFMGNVVSLLRSSTSDPDKLKILDEKYTDIIMVFDLDPQHGIDVKFGESPDSALRRNANLVVNKAMQMAKKLNNSTDPTLGKLYINYPSIESYRDADDFFDPGFAYRKVRICDLCQCQPFDGPGYKNISAKGKVTHRKHLGAYTEIDFSKLAAMNAFKLRFIMEGRWAFFPYNEYRKFSDQSQILTKQFSLMCEALALWILNTSLFIIFDYKGKAFYDKWCSRCIS